MKSSIFENLNPLRTLRFGSKYVRTVELSEEFVASETQGLRRSEPSAVFATKLFEEVNPLRSLLRFGNKLFEKVNPPRSLYFVATTRLRKSEPFADFAARRQQASSHHR